MLNTYNSSSQTAAVDQVLIYDTDSYNQGTAISHTPGSGVITLNAPGVYSVTFNGIAEPTEAPSGVNAIITAQLYKNGVAVINGVSSDTVAAETDIANLSFGILVEGPTACPCMCSCANTKVTLTIQNEGSEANYTMANVVVVKVR